MGLIMQCSCKVWCSLSCSSQETLWTMVVISIVIYRVMTSRVTALAQTVWASYFFYLSCLKLFLHDISVICCYYFCLPGEPLIQWKKTSLAKILYKFTHTIMRVQWKIIRHAKNNIKSTKSKRKNKDTDDSDVIVIIQRFYSDYN